MGTKKRVLFLAAAGLSCAWVLGASSRPRLNPNASVVVGGTAAAAPTFGTQDLEADLISFLSFLPDLDEIGRAHV